LIDRALKKGIMFRDLYYFAKDSTIPNLMKQIDNMRKNTQSYEQVIYKTDWWLTTGLIVLIETIDIILFIKLK
jgi:hypothetical protein